MIEYKKQVVEDSKEESNTAGMLATEGLSVAKSSLGAVDCSFQYILSFISLISHISRFTLSVGIVLSNYLFTYLPKQVSIGLLLSN